MMNEDFYGQFKFRYREETFEIPFRGKRPDRIILGEFRLMSRKLGDGSLSSDHECSIELEKFFKYFGEQMNDVNSSTSAYNDATKIEIIEKACKRLLQGKNYITLFDLDIQIDVLMFLIYKLENEIGIEKMNNEYVKIFTKITDHCLKNFNVMVPIPEKGGQLGKVNPMYGFLNL